MKLSIIVAVSENGVIGRENALIWRLPADLKRFKALTMGHPIIMGRKTFESIGRPLPGRSSIVISTQVDYRPEGVFMVKSIEEAIAKARSLETDESFIIGGGEIYRQTMPMADKLYLTKVKTTVEGDTFFEIPTNASWEEVFSEKHVADSTHEYSYEFVDLEKT
ncbi:dihydrofolate reductase [Dyadobacter jejuensis]|uniref:Dihydrofolate reductase n=1 Tax=Dyadobacter jejuensis TaxID=1082580 RepID=A0A316AA59_9BACT|nr:dihydrofolate reductase [Dyadobacter jejuensis]PWJ54289.1 dihydrofolate reductase [Dyadobacter jejuensis]